MKPSLIGCSFGVALLAMAVGCGPSGPATSLVSGTVTFDGEPVSKGHVIFRSASGEVASAAGEIVDGRYEFESVPGQKNVMITAFREIPGKFDESNPGEKVPAVEQYIPAEYNRKTELTVDVPEEDFTHDFALMSS